MDEPNVTRNNYRPGGILNRLSQPSFLWAATLILLSSSSMATTIVMPTDEQLVEKSPVIVRGTVVSSSAIQENGSIYTDTVVSVEQTLKGAHAATVTVREMGGIVGDRITKVYGTPEFEVGERVLLFLSAWTDGRFRTIDLFAGKFGEKRSAGGRPVMVRNDDDPYVTVLNAGLAPVESPSLLRDAGGFISFVHERVAGHEGQRDYFISAEASSRLRAQSNFTLIAEPDIYRWFAFDNGGSVRWTSSGSQSGYAGGGVNELNTAMASWTGFTGARIRYTYDGESATAPGGLTKPNGRNEILFNDPLNEIDGTFSPSTGGVVGKGGFNGVANSQNWTAPFEADPVHTARTYRAWNITEGNLTIQDGVTSARFSSGRLAEIVSHELGHTLGLGHSGHSTALMYASITGLGPSLRDDDRLAASWLYPSGTATPPVTPPAVTRPPAPSNFTATLSGTTVTLQWIDNATDETGQTVYVSTGGAFVKWADFAANVRSTVIPGVTPGTYSFYVVAFNSGGTSNSSNIATVSLAPPPALPALVAAFVWGPSLTVAGEPVSFTDQSTGGVTSRMWNFGDGSTSAQATPVKRYVNAGTYTVTLTVYRGSESRVLARTISIGQSAPIIPEPASPPAKRRAARRG